jgi:ATPase subunit of ABC transporter with duplicated ATPase domains
MTGSTCWCAGGALLRARRQRRGQVDAAEAGDRHDGARCRVGDARRQREARLLRAARHGLLDGDRTVFETLEDQFPRAGQGSLRALAGCFGFSGDEVEKRCRVLSGGEKARLVMAMMLYDPPNFLVLDEPTNHLDMATKEMLIAALAQYEGTMLFVSHDRHFLARCRTACWS